MVFRLCLCVALLFVCGYANKSSDYCRVLLNKDTFTTSLDQFLASWNETGGVTDMGGENKTACLAAVDRRVIDLENKVANLTSERSADCGPPPQQQNTDVYISSGFQSIATYTCKTGFVSVHLGQQPTGWCQKDRNWTKVNLKCFNLSSCWLAPTGRALYTGTVSNTTTGRVCQRWDSQEPHGHNNYQDAKFSIPGFDPPPSVTESANYCRDPDYEGFAWCYTTDPSSRFERCDVPECEIQD
ncbi:plasminogen-like [Haliotis rubra]|uniref:plasminogen-like n=1 Tax=Haliotis rubra TaxID=36100 RepID=UPI001EE5C75B|nr:plasminogen-like [Haliotis rubra]